MLSPLSSSTPGSTGSAHLNDQLPPLLQQRMNKIAMQVFQALKEMQISSQVSVVFNLHQISPNPNVQKLKDEIRLEIPILFLIEREDVTPHSPVFEWTSRNLKAVSDKDRMNLKIFEIFMKKAFFSCKGKDFCALP